MKFLDLDANATTPLAPAAFEAMRPWLTGGAGNAASAHHAGRRARQHLEAARETIAELLGAAPASVLFTSGATEANNLAVLGQMARVPAGDVLASPIEHPCVIEPLKALTQRRFTVRWLPVSNRGVVQVADVAAMATPETRLVALMLANHETGAVQPVVEVARLAPKSTAVHCDAAQAIGKVPVHFRELGVTTLSLSAHKFGGPQGVGALLVADGVALSPLMYGGHQQGARRPGTEPVALAVGLAAALAEACRTMTDTAARLTAYRTRFLAQLHAAGVACRVNGPAPGDADGLPNTLNLSFPGCRSDVLLMSLDLAGVACSAGSACSSGSLLPSPVLQAMGVADEDLRSAVRFSFGPTLSVGDVDEAAGRVAACVQRVASRG